MNYLGHIYFSNNDKELMYANIFGDFVRGNKFQHYPIKIRQGIKLHRKIDDFIDTHEGVLELLHKLYKPLPKVAGIAVDLYFDHLLATKWDEYHTVPYVQFLDEFHNYPVDLNQYNSDKFSFLIERMREVGWIYYYKEMYGLRKASEGLSNRLSFENTLHTAPMVFLDYEKEITLTFKKFMIDARDYFDEYFLKMNE